jgi:hypothetical protein
VKGTSQSSLPGELVSGSAKMSKNCSELTLLQAWGDAAWSAHGSRASRLSSHPRTHPYLVFSRQQRLCRFQDPHSLSTLVYEYQNAFGFESATDHNSIRLSATYCFHSQYFTQLTIYMPLRIISTASEHVEALQSVSHCPSAQTTGRSRSHDAVFQYGCSVMSPSTLGGPRS